MEVQTHFLLQLTDVNNDHHDHSIIKQYHFCKRGPKFFAYRYIILRFSFFSSCERNIFISDQLEAEKKIASTWHNERMNERTCKPFWSEISTAVKTLQLQNKLSLVNTILGSLLPDIEQRLLLCSLHFEANDFPVLGLHVGPSRSHMKIYLDLTFPPMWDFAEL